MHSFRRALGHTSAYFFMPQPGTGPERLGGAGRMPPLGGASTTLSKRFAAGRHGVARAGRYHARCRRRVALSACWGRRGRASRPCWHPGRAGAARAGAVTLYSGDGPVAGPRLGQVGYMPQRDLLLPWRTALDNAVAGLEVRGVPAAEAQAAARAFCRVRAGRLRRQLPHDLSGGMRQRVSFARSALAGPRPHAARRAVRRARRAHPRRHAGVAARSAGAGCARPSSWSRTMWTRRCCSPTGSTC